MNQLLSKHKDSALYKFRNALRNVSFLRWWCVGGFVCLFCVFFCLFVWLFCDFLFIWVFFSCFLRSFFLTTEKSLDIKANQPLYLTFTKDVFQHWLLKKQFNIPSPPQIEVMASQTHKLS